MTDPTPEHPTTKTSTALTFTQPRTPEERYVFARSLAEARQLPGQIRGSQADVLLRIEYGVAVGIPPVSALTAIHLIDGKPTASAGMISGLLRTAGRLRVWTEPDPKHEGEVFAVATYVRNDDPTFEYRVEWTIDRAVAAGLLTISGGRIVAAKQKSAWQTYRAGMLKARAISEIGRDAAEDVLLGVHYTPEELGANVNAEGEVIEGEIVGESHTVRDYTSPPAPAEPTVDVTAERLEEVRGLILAAWQDADLDALTTVFRGPVQEYGLAADLEVEELEEIDGKPTGEVVTLEELLRRVGRRIRDEVPAPASDDESGPDGQEGPSGGSAAPTGPAEPPAGDGGGAVTMTDDGLAIVDGEIVDDATQEEYDRRSGDWPETRQAPEGGSPMELPPEATVLDVMTPAQVAEALGGTVLTEEEAQAHAAAVGERLRNYAAELGRTGFDRGTDEQRRAYETGPAAARAALEAARRSRAGA